MIYISNIEIKGLAEAGEFSGALQLKPGLQVISAKNAYGKTLAVKAIAWCFGLEPIFGNVDNDPAFFPEAARESLELSGHALTRVISSSAAITIRDESGRQLEIQRDIRGGDPALVVIREISVDGKTRESKLFARKLTMSDEHGGFQRFFFEWMNWPRINVATYRQSGAEVYLENLAPLFYIDQAEGWSNLQALQIGRYGQQEIGEISIEYLLGAFEAITARVNRLLAAQRSRELKDSAELISHQAMDFMMRRGWRVQWSSHGSLREIISRWSSVKFSDALKRDASVDIETRYKVVAERIEKLRDALTKQPIDTADTSAPIAASQRVIQLKEQRHSLNRDLHTLRAQKDQAATLIESLDHRLLAANDLLRLKQTGVGRLDHIECPTCHRDMDASLFGLSSQSAESVAAHIEALKRDRELIRKNIESLDASIKLTTANINELDSQVRDADRALTTLTSAVGTVREQLAATATNLAAAERELERLEDASKDVTEIQASIDRWIIDARSFETGISSTPDVHSRKLAFVDALKKYLVALGHSAVRRDNASLLSLDDQYVPYMDGRRLRGLGSASDQSRLVAAFTLALAAASQQVKGKHPGFVILDEPLQQNPDEKHQELFLTFLEKQLAQQSKFQTVIFTWLSAEEIARLRQQNTIVITPSGQHFLQLKTKPKKQAITSQIPPPPEGTPTDAKEGNSGDRQK
ncbi:hypothetical protein DYQ86_09525 [Acidobacteria bacterium AB60]|nr:hypothetical protein DYQ86_09525 [Acidobacteria bacterium AB60]